MASSSPAVLFWKPINYWRGGVLWHSADMRNWRISNKLTDHLTLCNTDLSYLRYRRLNLVINYPGLNKGMSESIIEVSPLSQYRNINIYLDYLLSAFNEKDSFSGFPSSHTFCGRPSTRDVCSVSHVILLSCPSNTLPRSLQTIYLSIVYPRIRTSICLLVCQAFIVVSNPALTLNVYPFIKACIEW